VTTHRPRPRPTPRVLVVDDTPATVDVLVRALRRSGHTDVAAAGTVADALALLGGVLPGAILLDLSLSLQDGHLLLRHVRRAPHWSPVPVFMLMGRHPASAIRAAALEGATGFIAQPFNGLELVYKIEQAVNGVGARAAELDDLLQSDPETGQGQGQERAGRPSSAPG
jgi:CheY-like chemotaxis protein